MLVLGFGAACSSGGPDHSAQPASSAAASPASTKVDALITTGLAEVSSQQYDAASATFTQVLDLDATNVYATYNLGYIAQQRGDDSTAIRNYTATLVQDKTFAPALYNLAILTESSDLPGAVALYQREIALKPDDAAAHMRLGFALRHLGEDAEAIKALHRGIELDPAMADVQSPAYSS